MHASFDLRHGRHARVRAVPSRRHPMPPPDARKKARHETLYAALDDTGAQPIRDENRQQPPCRGSAGQTGHCRRKQARLPATRSIRTADPPELPRALYATTQDAGASEQRASAKDKKKKSDVVPSYAFRRGTCCRECGGTACAYTAIPHTSTVATYGENKDRKFCYGDKHRAVQRCPAMSSMPRINAAKISRRFTLFSPVAERRRRSCAAQTYSASATADRARVRCFRDSARRAPSTALRCTCARRCYTHASVHYVESAQSPI